jgi:hypothetical protein
MHAFSLPFLTAQDVQLACAGKGDDARVLVDDGDLHGHHAACERREEERDQDEIKRS